MRGSMGQWEEERRGSLHCLVVPMLPWPSVEERRVKTGPDLGCFKPKKLGRIPYLLPFRGIWDIGTRLVSVASLPLLGSALNQKWCRCGINCESSIFLAAPKKAPSAFFSWPGINPEWMNGPLFSLLSPSFPIQRHGVSLSGSLCLVKCIYQLYYLVLTLTKGTHGLKRLL